jgi:anti-sigma factor RsiW
MNCRAAIQAIVLASTGDLTLEGAVALASHLQNCARCRSEEKFAALITAALETNMEPAPRGDFTGRVLDRIRDANAAAPRERAWMSLVPAAALLSAMGAAWLASPLIPWREMMSALGSHPLPAFSGPAALAAYASILPTLLVVTGGLVAFAAREFASFMRE